MNGFVLAEILIATALFMIFASAMVSMVLGSISIIEKAADHSFASNLSQEGLEAVLSIQNKAWNNLEYNSSALNFQGGWLLAGEGSEETIAKFLRHIEIDKIYRNLAGEIVLGSSTGAVLDINSLKISSLVSWQDKNTTLSSVNSKIISNWSSSIWEQNDWSGLSNEEILINSNTYDQSFSLDISSSIKLEEISTSTFSLSGYLISSAFGPTRDGIFSTIEWTEIIPENCLDCLIKVQIKTAEDSNGAPINWSNTWSGPDGEDGDDNDYFLDNEGSFINTSHNQDKWIKYKIILEGDGEKTPEFTKIKIYYK